MSSPNRSTKKRSVAEKGKVDNGTSAKKMREEEESKIPGIKQEETSEVPGMLKQETGEETDALKQETDDEMDALKHETDDEIEEEDDVNSPPLPPLPGASELAEGTLNADSNGDFFQAGEDGDNGFFGGDDSAGSNVHANTSQALDSYKRNETSSGGSREARPHIGIANPNDNKFIAKWNDRCFELIDYKEEHGHCNVPRKYEGNKQLCTWVDTQRKHYRKFNEGREAYITQERIDKLNNIGFKWDANEAAWEAKLEELIEYQEEHGHCNVPTKYEANKQLANWVGEQRKQRRLLKEGKSSGMTKERIDKLNEIGFVWNAIEAAWPARFAELVAYKAKHGDCNVPKNEENKQLGKWVENQRKQCRFYQEGKEAHITQERIDKLNENGFVWEPDEDAWEAKLAQLIAYKEKHGDCNVPNRFKENKPLGTWVNKQRAEYRLLLMNDKKSQMTGERIVKLEEIGFKWRLK